MNYKKQKGLDIWDCEPGGHILRYWSNFWLYIRRDITAYAFFRAAIFVAIFLPSAIFSQALFHWRSGTLEDFLSGTRRNIDIITPDPDGTDDGAIKLSAHDTIRVLQVYPPGHNTQVFAEGIYRYQNDGMPRLNFIVDLIDIGAFNRTPTIDDTITVTSTIYGTMHRRVIRDYDIIAFGIGDSYGGQDLSPHGAELVRAFARLGRGILLTHDTIANGMEYHPNFNSLTDITGISTRREYIWYIYDYVYLADVPVGDPVLHRPFELPREFDVLDCHDQGQVNARGTTWYEGRTFVGREIYMHTYHNPEYNSYAAFFNYGHTEAIPAEWEAKAMINTMYYSYYGGRGVGVFVSPIHRFPCIAILQRAIWSAEVPAGGMVEVRIRTSNNGVDFSDWTTLAPGPIPSEIETCFAVQYEVIMNRGSGDDLPVFHYIDFEYTMDVPQAVLIYPPLPNMITSCRCQQIRFLVSSYAPLVPESSRIMINGVIYGPHGLVLSGDTLIFTPSEPCFYDGELVTGALVELSNSIGCRSLDSVRFAFRTDTSPPVVHETYPPDGSIILSSSPVISVLIADSISGVSPSSIRISINGERFSYPASGLNFAGDTLSISSATLGFSFDSLVNICIDTVSDRAELCGRNTSEPYCWSFFVDRHGPIVNMLEPTMFSSCESLLAVFSIHDTSGFIPESLVFAYGSRTLRYPENIEVHNNIIVVHDSVWLEDGAVLNIVCVSAMDGLGNRSETYNFIYIVDREPPRISILAPRVGEAVGVGSPLIFARITDSLSGLDTSSIIFIVQGIDTLPFNLSYSYFAGDTLVLDLGRAGYEFTDGETVFVAILAGDNAELCGANIANPESTFFWVDLGGPRCTLIFPRDGDFISCDSLTIAMRIIDPNGVNPSTIVFNFDSVNYDISSSRLLLSGDTLFFFSPYLVEGRRYEFSLVRAEDIFGNPLATSDEWYFVVDKTPPVFSSQSPTGFISDSFPTISVLVHDFISGVLPESLQIIVNGQTITMGDSCVSYDETDGLLVLNTRVCDNLNLSQTNTVEVIAQDRALVCGGNRALFSWQFETDFVPPIAELLFPENGSYISCPSSRIAIYFRDRNGTRGESILLTVEADTLTYFDPRVEFRYDTLIIAPYFNFAENETVNISVLSVSDTLGNSILEPINFFFMVDRASPYVDSPVPLPGSSVVDLQPTISISIYDDGAGVDSGSIRLRINGYDHGISSPALVWASPGLYFYPESIGLYFPEEESVYVSLIASDRTLLCPPNTLEPFGWNFYIQDDDTTPPRFISYSPHAFMEDSSFYITLVVVDSSGIYTAFGDSQSPYILYATSSTLDSASTRLNLQAIRVIGDTTILRTATPIPPITTGERVIFRAIVWDNDYDLGRAVDRRKASSELMEIYIRRRPRVEIIYPPNNSYTSCATGPVLFLVRSSYGIDEHSGEFSVGGEVYRLDSPNVRMAGDTIIFAPLEPFEEGRYMVEFLSLQDTLGDPLITKPSSTFFVDLTPPVVGFVSPREWEMVPDANFVISGRISDPAGVPESLFKLCLTIRSETLCVREGDNGLVFDTTNINSLGFVYTPSIRRSPSDTIVISISFGDGVIGCPPNMDTLSYSFWIEPHLPCSLSTNPFTPNGDGANDRVYFFYPGLYSKHGVLKIFDINGRLVRRVEIIPGDQKGSFWDGKGDNGHTCATGTYIYIIEANGKRLCSGSVTLAR